MVDFGGPGLERPHQRSHGGSFKLSGFQVVFEEAFLNL